MGHKWRKILTWKESPRPRECERFCPSICGSFPFTSTSVERGDLEKYRLEEECAPAKEQYWDLKCRNPSKGIGYFLLR
jgi:hypothetical protein